MVRRLLSALGLGACLITGCGYHWGDGLLTDCYSTISVPYVVGDTTGILTAALVRELGQATPLEYVNTGGELCLQINICERREENIGYRYDVNNEGQLTHSVIPTETRMFMAADVTVIDTCEGTILLGPVRISASVDFDHEFYQSRNGINVFSLGQLTDIRDAREAALTPLSQALAQKIVDYVSHVW